MHHFNTAKRSENWSILAKNNKSSIQLNNNTDFVTISLIHSVVMHLFYLDVSQKVFALTGHRTYINEHDPPWQRMHFMPSFKKSSILSSMWFIKGVYLISHYICYSDHSAIVSTWTSNGHMVIRSTLTFTTNHIHTNTFSWEKLFAPSSEKLINLCYKKWNMSILVVDHFRRISKGLPWSELVLYHLHAQLVWGNIKAYLYFPSFINIAQVI